MKPQNIAVKSLIDFIIFGSGNYNSLGVLHAMAHAGHEAFILCIGNSKDRKQGNIIGYSRFAKNIIEVESADEGIEWLLENKSAFPKDTIIYPTGDNEEKSLDNNYAKLKNHFIFPQCKNQGDVTNLMDKNIQIDLAEKHGLRILKSQFSNSAEFSFGKVEYPCMVKPINSTSGTKGDMKVCKNEEELKCALKGGTLTRDFIVQKYIENESDLLFLGIALPNGNVIIPALVRKPGVSPTGEYTHAIITTDIDKYLPEKEQVVSFVKNLNYTGPFSIEFGLEKEKNYFFEINLRNDGTSHYPLRLGVNIPLIYYNSIKNKSQAFRRDNAEYEMIDEVADLRRVLGKEINLIEWIKRINKAGSYKFYNKNDKRLLFPILSMFINRSSIKLFKFFK